MSIPAGATRVAFLDRHGRFAKGDDGVELIRFFDDQCNALEDMAPEDYSALTYDEQTAINELGSAAGCIDTAHKSNA